MIVRESLESILRGLFPDSEVAGFSSDWILNNPRVTKDSVIKVYRFLSGKGLKDNKIASRADLLGMNPETIERNYQRLSALGLKDNKIASRADLLGRDPETIERNYQMLSALGLKDDKIATHAHLLGMNPETIERNYQMLSALGLKDDKIATNAHLLGRGPETIERNYRHHVGLLRLDYNDRTSGRELLTNQAQLLGISPETINENVQYLNNLGVDYNDAFLLGTTTQLKRKKMAWMLRELFDYRNLNQERRRDAIAGLYDFVRNDPRVLTKSISSMKKAKDKLRERATQYKR